MRNQHFINGEWIGEPTIPVLDPATGAEITQVADADIETAILALDAAVAAQRKWAHTAPRERAELLRGAFEAIVSRSEEFATLITREMGKPIAEAHSEVTYGAEFFRWFSEEAVRIHGRFGLAPSGKQRIVTDKVPVGPVFAITPWNFPLAMATRKIGPALAAGCTVVIKPATYTPLTTLLLLSVLDEVGIPKGVVNCFTTTKSRETSAALIRDPRLRKLTFTGSTLVGKELLKLSSEHVLRTSMELGGNAPFIVLESADVEAAVEGALVAKMRNNGQACTAANRFFVHERVMPAFSKLLHKKLADYQVGPGIEPTTQLGALISAEAVQDIISMIDDAVAHGAVKVLGGAALEGQGAFLPPTILSNVDPSSRIVNEEIFGPVVALQSFRSTQDLISRANDSAFGLMSYVFGEQSEALRIAEKLEYAMTGINTGLVSDPSAPFGGMKQSGLGREGSFEGIEEYLETKYYGMKL